ncbi:MAG: hypothetical protein Q9213_003197 [Squamulea squamosa]
MEAVGLAAGVAQLIDLAIKSISYLNSIKNASRERSSLFQEISSLLPLLATLESQIGEAKQSEVWFNCVRLLAAENGIFEQLREKLSSLAKELKPRKGFESVTHAFLWTFDKAHCEALLQKIQNLKSIIALALQGDMFKLAEAIKADTAGIQIVEQRVATILDHVQDSRRQEDLKKRQAILAWLSPLNFFKVQQDIFARREDGTCQCSVGVAAIYCSFKQREAQTPQNLLAGACAQLVHDLSKQLPEPLMGLHESHDNLGTRPGWIEIYQLFQGIVKRLDTVFLIIDALDEGSEEVRCVIVPKLGILPPNVRVLVTTRQIEEIIDEFRGCPKLQIRAIRYDLEKYILSRITSSKKLKRHVQGHPELEQEICDEVTSKANGM